MSILQTLLFTLILITFSRGSIIALCFFVFFNIIIGKQTLWSRWAPVVCFALALLIVGLVDFLSIQKCIFSIGHIESNGDTWRINNISMVFNHFNEIPLCGYGCGTYNWFLTSLMGLNSLLPIVSITPNIISRILVEQGVIGLVWSGAFTCFVVFVTYKSANTYILPALLSLIIKELTSSDCHNIGLVYVIIAAYIGSVPPISRETFTITRLKIIHVLSLILALYFSNNIFQKVVPTKKAWVTRERDMQMLVDNFSTPICIISAFEEPHNSFQKDMFYPLFFDCAYQGKIVSADSDVMKNNCYHLFFKGINKLYASKNVEGIAFLSKSISLNPSLLQTNEFHEICRRWPKITHHIRNYALKELSNNLSDAKSLAKGGYILCYFGQNAGKKKLEEALQKMPSLVMPWKLLGYSSFGFRF